MDQRVEKTYDQLQMSLRDLLKRYKWKRITIKLICDDAEISRSTFYSHFHNKEDLLDSLISLLESALLENNRGRSLAEHRKFGFIPMFVEHVAANKEIFGQSNSTGDGYPVASKFRKMVLRLVEREVINLRVCGLVQPSAIEFIAGGIYESVIQWSIGKNDLSRQQLIGRIDDLVRLLLRD